MKRIIAASILAVASIASGAVAQAPETPVEATTQPSSPTDAEVDALVQQLDNPDAAVADRARTKLLQLGDRAKAALDRKLRGQTAAVDVLTTLQSQQFSTPTLISLKLTNASADEAVTELSKQVGVSLKARAGNFPPVEQSSPITCDLNRQPFWTVVRTICDKTQLAPNSTPGEGGLFSLAPVGRSIFKLPVSTQGPVLVVLTNLTRLSTVDLQTMQLNPGQITGQLELWCEPKMRPISVTRDATVDTATDDAGNALAPRERIMSGAFPDQVRQNVLRASFQLTTPQSPGKTIKIVSGKIKLLTGIGEQRQDLSDVLTGKEVTKADAEGKNHTFSAFKKNGTRFYNVRVSLPPDQRAGPPTQPALTLVASDDAGHLFPQTNVSLTRAGARGPEYSVSFQAPADDEGRPIDGPPTKLTWVYPLKSQEMLVPFEFKDLPLP